VSPGAFRPPVMPLILMAQFLEVARQHIWSMVVNVTYCLVSNLTEFLAVKEFGKSVNIWWNYRHSRVANFSESQCIYKYISTSSSSLATNHTHGAKTNKTRKKITNNISICLLANYYNYCKTLFFRCIWISWFSHVKNLLHFNLAFFIIKIPIVLLLTYYKEYCIHITESLIFYADKLMVMGNSKNLRVFNFAILLKSWIYTFNSITQSVCDCKHLSRWVPHVRPTSYNEIISKPLNLSQTSTAYAAVIMKLKLTAKLW